MSTKEGEPLLSVEKLLDEFCEVHPYHAQIYAKQSACWVRDFYEAARAKDAELIQQLVDAMEPKDCHHPYCLWVRDQRNECDCHMAVLAAAKEAGFTPSEP
jgi:hypothetical protein